MEDFESAGNSVTQALAGSPLAQSHSHKLGQKVPVKVTVY